MLPAGAVFSAVAVLIALRRLQDARSKIAVVVAVLVFAGGSYASAWRSGSISFREALVNSRTRLALETELAKQLKRLPKDATFLMYLGDHVGAMQQAGIPLRRVINEGNHRTWKRPADPDGLWERALQNPARYADFVVAMDGDQVSRQVNKQQLASVMVVHVLGQPAATIYRTVNSTSQ